MFQLLFEFYSRPKLAVELHKKRELVWIFIEDTNRKNKITRKHILHFCSLGLGATSSAGALPLVKQSRDLVPLLVQLGLLVALADLSASFST